MTVRPALVLASNSPRRRQLVALGNWPFRIEAREVDEQPRFGEPPSDYVVRLAEDKARAAAAGAGTHEIILAADTTVVANGSILGKPEDRAAARRALRQLRGHTHHVFTGLAALRVSDGRLETEICRTAVPMRNYSDAEIDRYVATDDPRDKAGAYSIQHPEFHPVTYLQGCYASVMGMPLCHATRLLSRFDLEWGHDVAARCQATLAYDCPVSDRILRGEQVG